ncbi:MAG: FHA domain-containing protein [Anaerolineales bacterium]|nr:FHA domain-containing protein [Anaerolineales bacterium]
MLPFRRIFPRPLCGCLLLALIGLLLRTGPVHSQAVASTLRIVRVDSSAFPEVKVQILVLGPGGIEAAAPTAESLALSENNVSVEYGIEKQETGAEIGFILDTGLGLYRTGAGGGTVLQEMKDAVVELTQDPLLLTGKDVFYVISQQPGGPQALVSPETQATQIPNILNQYNPAITYHLAYPLEGVSALLDSFLDEASQGAGKAQAIVVLSSEFHVDRKYPLSSVVQKAVLMGVPVHTIQVRFAETEQEDLKQLAEQTGGRYFYYTAEGAASIAGLKPQLTGLRTQYVLTYRSPNAESGTRVVAVGLKYGQGQKPVLAQYDIEVEPPVAVIRSPGDEQTISPESYRPTEDTQATPVTGIVVTASVSWPDSYPRKILRATLLVNNTPQTVLDEPSEELTFVWNPTEEYLDGPATLQVQIEDELGLFGLSDQIVVRIEASSAGGFNLCPPGSDSPLCSLSLGGVLPYLSLVIALAALVLVIVFRKPIAGTAQQAVGAATEFIQEVGETLRFKSRPGASKAMLVDLDGNTGTGRSSFELYGTTSIGRSKKNADLVFQANQPDSPISRLHCTILEEDGAYFLRDDQSANGTYLNGVRLVPMDRNPLKDGDEIQLANPERSGVRLQFRGQGGGGFGGGADTESTNRMSRE